MIYINAVSKQYGHKVLLREVQFHLRPNERVGFVGENGAGKTTLLRLILDEEGADGGSIVVRKGARVAMLAQELVHADETILERVVMGDKHFGEVKKGLDDLARDEELRQRSLEEWNRRYGGLQHEFERLGGYGREAKAKAILEGLGFRSGQMDSPLSKFSGGWRMRVELARLLLQNPDVLLLDEPTNHLDLHSVVWLESFLKNYEGSLLLISHDRRFLNGLAERIVELDRGTLTSYTGNYDDYERRKAERESLLEKASANQQRRIAEIERFIERFRAKNTKASQVQSRVKMLEKMERVETAVQSKTVDFRFPQPARCGREVIVASGVDKSYGPVTVYKDFSARLERGWKVALVGVNGAGKSTLLKMMAGIVEPDRGEVKLGFNATRAYYAQHHSDLLDPALTVQETIEQVGSHLLLTQLRNILGAFLFSGDDARKKVGVLSGGERARLTLARMLVNPASLLLLDEPTNHLDMKSCEILSAALADYEGTLCAISHDRFFLDGIVNRVWEIDNGVLKEYVGNYSEYEWAKSRETQPAPQENGGKDTNGKTASQKDREQKRQEAEARNRRYRQLRPLQEELETVEKRLDKLMQEKRALEERLADPAFYEAERKDRLMETLDRQRNLHGEERDLLRRWEDLSSEIERADCGG
ncbi:MAG: ABC-F family ATP-binding cassette domain-containing protein [Nitrospinae bacterium]|nr:ABC-F family ATP-binding cassette domain-containing protein [Nitrospinota bacterium]